MRKVPQEPYLYIHRSYFYFRITVPSDLKAYYPYFEYKKSLKTTDLKIARTKCWRLSSAALSFFDYLRRSAMHLTEEKIKEIVRNHFEKRLLDASEDYIFNRDTVRNDTVEGFSPDVLKYMLSESEKRLEHYRKLKSSHDYGEEQERIARELIKFNDIEYSKNKTEFFQLCYELVRAHFEAERINTAYLSAQEHEGRIIDPYFQGCTNFFENPDPVSFFEYQGKPYYQNYAACSLKDAYEKYIQYKRDDARQRGKSQNTLKEYDGFFARLFDIWGADTDVSKITKTECNKLKNYLVKFPFKYRDNFESKGIGLLSVLNGEHGDYEKIGPSQAKKMWDAYKDFFSWAKENELVDINPFLEIEFKGKKHSRDDRDPFSEEQLKAIFSSPIYTGRKNPKKAMWIGLPQLDGGLIIRDGNYWVPLVALFSGMRMGEILQLKVQDIKSEHDVYYFDLKHIHLKTNESCRNIPIHDELIKMGLIKFWNDRKRDCSEKDYLFNNIPRPEKDRITNKYSSRFSTYLKKLDIKTKKTTFHSFRHNFEDAMVDADVPERSQFALMGHTPRKGEKLTNHSYGSGVKIKKLREHISLVRYEFLDLSHLYFAKN